MTSPTDAVEFYMQSKQASTSTIISGPTPVSTDDEIDQ